MRVVVSPQAGRDIVAVLRTSKAEFGAEARDRYRRLIQLAFEDLVANPSRNGVRSFSGDANGPAIYHIRYSRRRGEAMFRVVSPRHVVAFRVHGDVLEILRVLHDAMDIPRLIGGE